MCVCVCVRGDLLGARVCALVRDDVGGLRSWMLGVTFV